MTFRLRPDLTLFLPVGEFGTATGWVTGLNEVVLSPDTSGAYSLFFGDGSELWISGRATRTVDGVWRSEEGRNTPGVFDICRRGNGYHAVTEHEHSLVEGPLLEVLEAYYQANKEVFIARERKTLTNRLRSAHEFEVSVRESFKALTQQLVDLEASRLQTLSELEALPAS